MEYKSRIVIIDDDLINIQVLESALGKEFDICTAQNGFDGIRLIKENHPDLILLDVMMPDMNGFDVCRIIKEEESFADTPIIFLTAMDTAAAELTGLGLGGIDYIFKPINLDLLKVRVRNHAALKARSDLVKVQRDELARQKEELENALARVKHLEGIIPICSYCKKIRDDHNSWNQLEKYISEHTDAVFSHGACPDCFEEQMKIIATLK